MKKIVTLIIKSFLICPLLLLGPSSLMSNEFLYPVGIINDNDEEKVCVIHQKNNALELWLWNPRLHTAHKALLSSFTPAALTVLPDKESFSFVDHDRIRIKNIHKRSPRSIDFCGPYDLTQIHWIDEITFYFGAKERQRSNLFHATIEGDLYRLTVSDTHDYLYPQKINDDFFFIEHNEKEYSILHTKYPSEQLKQAYIYDTHHTHNNLLTHKIQADKNEQAITPFLDVTCAEKIASFQDKTIAFLSMVSEDRGFFVAHPEIIERSQQTITFTYYMISKKDTWTVTALFDFTIPLHLLITKRGQARLYESILPLLPYYDKGTLYFVSLEKDCIGIDVFTYDLGSQTIVRKTYSDSPDQYYFTPLPFGESLFSGGSILNDFKPSSRGPLITIDQSGIEYFYFREIE